MLALEKIIASFLMLPGLIWLMWLFITIYIFKKEKSAVLCILLSVSLIFMYVLFTALGTSVLVVPLENMRSSSIRTENFSQNCPIVVLGGGIYYSKDKAFLNPYSLQRLVKGYEIYQKVKAPIIFTGGIAIDQKNISESEIAAEWLARMGVEKEDIIIEDNARTTYENGFYVKKWLSSRKVIYDQGDEVVVTPDNKNTVYLVTNALHLPRAIFVFEKQDVNVIPVSSGIVIDHQAGWLSYFPNRNALTANMMALHEWLGLVWYKITGRI